MPQKPLHRSSDVPEPVTTDTAAEMPTVEGAPGTDCWRGGACPQGEGRTETQPSACDETEKTIGRLRQAELRLLRALASRDARSDELARQRTDTLQDPQLDDLARLISWGKPAKNGRRVARRVGPPAASKPILIFRAGRPSPP